MKHGRKNIQQKNSYLHITSVWKGLIKPHSSKCELAGVKDILPTKQNGRVNSTQHVIPHYHTQRGKSLSYILSYRHHMLQEELWAPILASFNASRTGWAKSHMPYLMDTSILTTSSTHYSKETTNRSVA